MATDTAATRPGLAELFFIFSRLGLTSFGGGLSGWMMREFVHQRRWLSEDEFLSGLALSQAFPGVNVVNLAIWIGYRLRGGGGAFASATGMVVPAMILAILLAMVFSRVSQSENLHLALAGIAAAAIGLSLEMSIRAARRAANGVLPFLILVVTFAAIFILNLSLVWVVLCTAPCSVLIAYLQLRRNWPK